MNTKSKISLLLVDDHPMIRDAMKLYFTNRKDMSISAEASNGLEALEIMKNQRFDLIITDLNMAEMDGLDLIAEIRKTDPNQKILVISMVNEAVHIKKSIFLGANGYVLKNCPKEEIILAINSIVSGEQYFSKETMDLIIDNISGKKKPQRLSLEIPLTRRENEILLLIMEEKTNQQIAEKLFISPRTVEAHKRNLLEKTGSKTVAGLAIYAFEKGLMTR